jgi:hypothetical protein
MSKSRGFLMVCRREIEEMLANGGIMAPARAGMTLAIQ